MVTDHTTVPPVFVAGIVFGGKVVVLKNLVLTFQSVLVGFQPMASGTCVFQRVILYYCIQLQFPLLFDV